MDFRRLVVVCTVIAVVVAGAGLPIAGAAVAQETTETPGTDTAGNETAPMGTQLTAFMQHSAAHANDTVEDGMWLAAFERANESAQARQATQRAGDLQTRLDGLLEHREELRAQRDDGSLSEAEYAARASELNGRIDALRTAINESERAAERSGLNVTALETLKQDASNMTGPEVAGVARGLAGAGPPGDVGPPTDAGQPTDVGPPGTPGPGANATDAPPGGGPPDGGNDPGGGDAPDDPGQGDGPPGGGIGGK